MMNTLKPMQIMTRWSRKIMCIKARMFCREADVQEKKTVKIDSSNYSYKGFDVTDPRLDFKGTPITSSLIYNDVDPGPIYMDIRVRKLLESLNDLSVEDIMKSRKNHSNVEPQYRYMTDAELEEIKKDTQHNASILARPPPILKTKVKEPAVIEKNPALKGFPLNIVFTDISLNIPNHERLVVVREHDGTLRHSTADEHRRMIDIFYPNQHKDRLVPEMFTKERMSSLLDCECFEFLLDRACHQYEPFDPEFQAICAHIFCDIDSRKLYDRLQRTRYFSTMVFFFVWHKRMTGLLEHFLANNRHEDARQLLQLHIIVHPKSILASEVNLAESASVDLSYMVKLLLKETSEINTVSLELALKDYEERCRVSEKNETMAS